MRLMAYPSPNSSNEEIFNESAPFYKDKPQQSGDQQKLKYNPVNTKIHNKCNHKTIIIWWKRPCKVKDSLCFKDVIDKNLLTNTVFYVL